MCNIINAYHEAVKFFVDLSPEDVVARSGASYDEALGVYTVKYFGASYFVDSKGAVSREDLGPQEVPFNDKTLILQYLNSASGLPPRGRWLSFLELPDGAHHYVPLQIDATNPLAEIFGFSAGDFIKAALSLGGTPVSMGHYAYIIPALPKLPLVVMLWEGDDEFAASCNILFDAVAPTHLTTAQLWVLGVELARKMIGHFNKEEGDKKAITWLEGKS